MATKKTPPALVSPAGDGAYLGGEVDAEETLVTLDDLRNRHPDGLVDYEEITQQEDYRGILDDIYNNEHNSLIDPKNFLRYDGNVAIITGDHEICYLKDGIIFDDIDSPIGFVANGKVIIDGEMMRNGSIPVASDARISFTVLASLIAGEDRSSYNAFQNRNYVLKNWSDVKVVDFTTDEVAPFTGTSAISSNLRKYNQQGKHAMHKRGYSLVYMREFFDDDRHVVAAGLHTRSTYMWHKPATFVVTYKKNCYVLGQDEGSYFGSQLPAGSKPKNVAEAFKMLAPPEARGSGVLRQGEWFAIPVAAKDVPSMFDTSQVIGSWNRGDDAGYQLSRDSEDSAIHSIFGEVIVTIGGRVFAKNFTMTHSNEDHADMITNDDKWYYFKRNTSVANYSSQGMD